MLLFLSAVVHHMYAATQRKQLARAHTLTTPAAQLCAHYLLWNLSLDAATHGP